MMRLLELARRDMAERTETTATIEPVAPLERRVLDRVDVAPGSPPPDPLGLGEADHDLGERVVYESPIDASRSFFYAWSELSVTGPDGPRIGVVLQRTRAFRTSTEVQGGPLLGVSFWKLSATVYLFSTGGDDPFVVVAAAGSVQGVARPATSSPRPA